MFLEYVVSVHLNGQNFRIAPFFFFVLHRLNIYIYVYGIDMVLIVRWGNEGGFTTCSTLWLPVTVYDIDIYEYIY